MDKAEFGKSLRRYRMERGISVAWMAEKSGLTPPTIRSVEEGLHEPQPKTLIKICRVMGLEARKVWK